jgi:hypothetical protein
MADHLKIKAETKKDLGVIAALLQDALFRVDSMVYQAGAHRFALVANRFVWEAGEKPGKTKKYARTRSGLRFEGILGASLRNIPLHEKSLMLSLLTIEIEKDDQGFCVTLVFSGDGAIKLKAEVIEVYLEDLTGSWGTKLKPNHPVA